MNIQVTPVRPSDEIDASRWGLLVAELIERGVDPDVMRRHIGEDGDPWEVLYELWPGDEVEEVVRAVGRHFDLIPPEEE